MTAHPRLHLRAAALDSAALRRAEWALTALAIALRLLAVRTAAALGSARLQAEWALMALAIALRPPVAGRPVAEFESAASLQAVASHPVVASVPERARSSAELAGWARRSAGPVVSVARAALPLEEPAASDAVEAPQQVAVAWDAAEVLQQEVAALGEVAAPRRAVAWAGVALPPEAERQQEGRDAAAVPLRGAVLRAALDVQGAEPRAARPSAVLWVFRRDQALPWPAPQPPARSARAMHCLQIALPSAQSWQAVGDEVWSWWLGSRKKICNKLSRSTNKVRPDCGGLQRRTCFYFGHRKAQCLLVHCAFRRSFCPANQRYAHRWEKAYSAPAVRAPAIHPACCPVARQAAAARRDPAAAAAPQAVDFPAGFPAAAPTAAPA
jgi:hypothetical protein